MPDLPPVNEEFHADAGPYIAALEAMAAAADRFAEANARAVEATHVLHDQASDVATAMARDAAATSAAAAADRSAGDAGNRLAVELARVAAVTRAASAAAKDAASAATLQAAADNAAADAARNLAAADASVAAVQAVTTDVVKKHADATTAVTKSYLTLGKLFSGGFWGKGALTTWHYLIDGAIEFASVLIPAIIAVTAFGVAGVRTADAVLTHFQALTVVASATGQSVKPLTSALSNLSTALAPKVLQIYGDALQVVSTKTKAFATIATQAGTVLDRWAGRATTDLVNAAKSSGLLAQGSADLNGLLQVLANTLGIIGNLMRAAMITHFAEDFLFLFQAVTKVLDVITRLPAPLLAVGLAIHGLTLWGRLGAAVFGTLRNQVELFAANAGKLISVPKAFGAAFKEAGGGASGFAAALKAATGIPVWGWAIGGAVALGGLVWWLSRAKDSTQQWAASLMKAVDAAPIVDGMNVTFGALSKVNAALQQQTRILDNTTRLQVNLHTGADQVTQAYAAQAQKVGELTAAQKTFNQDAQSGTYRLTELAGKYGGLGAAIGAATLAGITWKQVLHDSHDQWQLDLQQIAATVQGYRMMGQSGTALANDVNAVTFATEMQDSKVAQMNQSWATFMSTVLGGESTFTTFAQQIHGLNQAADGLGATIKITNGHVSVTSQAASAAATSLNGLDTASLNLRSTWLQSITSASSYLQAIASMGAASANGAQSEHLITQAGKDVVAQFLSLAATSGPAEQGLFALAQEAGYHGVNSLKALAQWVGPGGAAGHMKDLNTVTGTLTGSVSNLTTDVNNLGVAIGVNLNAAMASAITGASGVMAATSKMVDSLMNTQTPIKYAQKATSAYVTDLEKTGVTAKQAGEKVATMVTQIMTGAKRAAGAHPNMQKFVADLYSIGQKANMSQGDIATMISTVTGMPKSKVLNIIMQLNGQTAGKSDFHKAGTAAATGTAQGITDNLWKVSDAGTKIKDKASHPASTLHTVLSTLGVLAVEGFVGGIISQFSNVVAAGVGLVSSLGSTVTGLLHMRSPSRVAYGWGSFTVLGFVNAILDGVPSAKNATMKLVGAVRQVLAGPINPGGLMLPTLRGGTPFSAGGSLMPLGGPGMNPGGPMGGAPVNINVDVHGHVLTEQALSELMRKLVSQYMRNNWGNGFVLTGRA